ncbi:MAG: diguanylate cyclase [Pseudobdellovibrionaceae bacterium]
MVSDDFDDNEDTLEKTSVLQSDTFRGKMQAADQAPPTLVLLVGPQGYIGKQWALTESEMVMGRSIDVQISIGDGSLSRSHAKFASAANEVSLMDLGSTNKTQVNGQPLPPLTPYKLKNNDQIKVGNVILKFLEQGSIEAASSQQMYNQAQKDVLTGAYSKAALLVRGPEAIKRSDVLGEMLSILVFDLDFFRTINTNHGHPGGDYVLKELGSLVSNKLVRANDFFARYGGEEFVVILQGSPLKQAVEVAERLRTTVENYPFVYNGQKVPVTVSVGVATRETAKDDWETLFKRADSALYMSKNNGRNRVSTA